jgi:hypothetical protein
VHSLVFVVGALVLLLKTEPSWRRDLAGSALFLLALVKPTLAAPFFWLVLFVPGRLRPGLLVVAGYIALTVVGAAFQEGGTLAVIRDWLSEGGPRDGFLESHANLHVWLTHAGLPSWRIPASLAVLAAFGLWVHASRRADPWVLVGAAALVSRMWAYHRSYDDLLALVAMAALVRVATRSPASRTRVLVGAVATIIWLFALLPLTFFRPIMPWGIGKLVWGTQIAVWLVALGILLYRPGGVQRESEPVAKLQQAA